MSIIKKLNLKNKLVYVCGGSGLIGKEISKEFINCGAKVINLDLIDKNKKTKKIKFEKFDVVNDGVNLSRINTLIKKYGVPDILIQAAYPTSKNWKSSKLDELKLTSFLDNFEMQLVKNIWFTKMIGNKMKKKGGSIIFLNSIYGLVAQDTKMYENTNINYNFTYAVIKGAITNAVRQMAVIYAKYKIRVNSVCPGGIIDKQGKSFVSKYSMKTPLKRMANAKDIAPMVVFLSTDNAKYITGINLAIDGGFTAI